MLSLSSLFSIVLSHLVSSGLFASGTPSVYAQTLILVNLILVKLIGFLVITRSRVEISGPY